jgi:epsilon-lactone hydrolase
VADDLSFSRAAQRLFISQPALVIDYRLAPEHPYPAAVQDAFNAYLWLRDTGGDEAGIVAAGDSSAGGLVMSLLLALRERDLPAPAGAAKLRAPGERECPAQDLEDPLQAALLPWRAGHLAKAIHVLQTREAKPG